MKKLTNAFAIFLCLAVSCQKSDETGNPDVWIDFPTYEKTTVDFLDTIPVTVSDNFLKSDFVAFTATVESNLDQGTSIATKSSVEAKAWEVEALPPVFDGNGNLAKKPCVVIKRIPMDGSDALLTASLVNSKGEKVNSSTAINSAKQEDLLARLETVFSGEIENWEDNKVLEFLCWYMYFLGDIDIDDDAEGHEAFRKDVLEFIDSHMKLLMAAKYSDLQDKGIADQVAYWKELLENPQSGDDPNTDFADDDKDSQFANGLYSIPDNRLLCHVSLPCAFNALSRYFDETPISSLSWIPGKIVKRLVRFQDTDIVTMFNRGVRVFEFPLIFENGNLYTNSIFLHDNTRFADRFALLADAVLANPSEFAIVIVSTSIKQTIMDLLKGEPAVSFDNKDLLNEIHKFFRDFPNSAPKYRNLFVPFRADMTVKDARGHILILWDDEWEDNTTVAPFGAVIQKPLLGDTGSIQTWDGKEWNDAADLMYQDIRYLGYCDSRSENRAAATRREQQMIEHMRKYQNAVNKSTPAPIWSINRMDCVFSTWMPAFYRDIIKKKTKVDIEAYPNFAWTASYVNYKVGYYFRDNYRYPGVSGKMPGGIVYLTMAAIKNCHPPMSGVITNCGGRFAVEEMALSNSYVRMPYER